METVAGIIIFLVVYGIIEGCINTALDNYDMSKVDVVKLSCNEAKGVSVAERRRRCINGYYVRK